MAWDWVITVVFPGIIATTAFIVSFISPYDSVECTWRRLRNEEEVAEYYAPVLGKEVIH